MWNDEPARADFEEQYDAAIDEAIEAGNVLEDDRVTLEGYSHPEVVSE